MKPTLAPLALFLVLAPIAARAQDEPTPDPAAGEANLRLSAALRRITLADTLLADVEVKHEPAEAAAGAAGPGVVVIQQRFGGVEPPFEGRVEAWRAADGTTVLVSATELPGFALCRKGERTIERTTVESDRFSLDQLATELTALLEAGALARHAFGANLEHRVDAGTGEVTFHGEVSRDIVPPTLHEMPLVQSRVLAAHVTLTVAPDGRLSRAAVRITRNDPARELMRNRRKMVIVGGGGGAVPPPAEDDGKKHDIVGGYTTYTLAFREGEPGARATAFKAEVERLLGAGER